MSGPEDATRSTPPAPEAAVERPPRRESIVGLVLIGIGALLLAGRSVADIGDYVTLMIGLGLLAIFAVTRAYSSGPLAATPGRASS